VSSHAERYVGRLLGRLSCGGFGGYGCPLESKRRCRVSDICYFLARRRLFGRDVKPYSAELILGLASGGGEMNDEWRNHHR